MQALGPAPLEQYREYTVKAYQVNRFAYFPVWNLRSTGNRTLYPDMRGRGRS